MITADDVAGSYAIIPTPARPGAGRLDATDTVDVDETRRLIDQLIADGVDGIIALGTTGECPTLTEADFEVMVGCVADAVGGRVPVFIGASALGAQQVVRRLRVVQEAGATGSLLGLPMWQPLTTEMAVAYYREISALFADLPLMVYANARAFRYSFPVEFWAGLRQQAPTVVAAKVSRAPDLPTMIEVTEGAVNFVPNEMKVHEFWEKSPQTTTACWSTAAAMGPEPAIAVLQAIRANDADAVRAAAEAIRWANEPVAPLIADAEIFASYNIQIEKVRIAAAGYCEPGPIRPPYAPIPEEYAAAARECGQRWRSLRTAGTAKRSAAG